MKLEVGKKYVTRDNPHIKYVRIDAIRRELENYAAVGTAYRIDTDHMYHHMVFNAEGYHFDVNDPSPQDLVAEYKEPELCITEKDAGRKVRLRNGTIALITSFHPDCDLYPVVCIGRSFSTKGRPSFRGDGDGDYDIIEFVD